MAVSKKSGDPGEAVRGGRMLILVPRKVGYWNELDVSRGQQGKPYLQPDFSEGRK